MNERDKTKRLRGETAKLTESEMDEFTSAVVGAPPDDFTSTIMLALKYGKALEAQLGEQKGMQAVDAALCLAMALLNQTLDAKEPGDVKSLALVQRVKQVAKWLTGEWRDRDPTQRTVLENKSVELARLVSQRLFQNEEFVLLLFNSSTPEQGSLDAFMAHISSAPRTDTIKLVQDYLTHLMRN